MRSPIHHVKLYQKVNFHEYKWMSLIGYCNTVHLIHTLIKKSMRKICKPQRPDTDPNSQ